MNKWILFISGRSDQENQRGVLFIRDAPPGGRRTGGPGWWFVTEAIMPHVSLIRLYYICMMLNYVLIDHYDIYGVDHVFKVTKDMLTVFFMDYAHEKKVNGKYRGPDSIERCVHAVALFFSKLIYKYGGYVALKRNELYIPKEILPTVHSPRDV